MSSDSSAATLAYRAAKVLRDVPAKFATTSFGPDGAAGPVDIVAHMGYLMAWGVTLAQGQLVWKPEGGEDWETEVQRFFDGLGAINRALAAEDGFAGSLAQLIQGPLADALTHVGQLAMLEDMAGAPRYVPYARAAIQPGRVGFDQPPAVREFDGDASRRR